MAERLGGKRRELRKRIPAGKQAIEDRALVLSGVFLEGFTVAQLHDEMDRAQIHPNVHAYTKDMMAAEWAYWRALAELIGLRDPLTGAGNRTSLRTEFYEIRRKAKQDGKMMCQAYLELDGFKAFNNLYSHELGNKALIAMVDGVYASGVRALHAEGLGELYRVGGDEFTVVGAADSWPNWISILINMSKRCVDKIRQRTRVKEAVTMRMGARQVTAREGYVQALLASDKLCIDARNAGGNCLIEELQGEKRLTRFGQ